MNIRFPIRMTPIMVGFLVIWALIGVLWMTKPTSVFVGYLRFQLDHSLGDNGSGDGFKVEQGGKRGGLLTIVRNGSRRSVPVSYLATGLAPNDILFDATSGTTALDGYLGESIVHVDHAHVTGSSSGPLVIVGENRQSNWDVRCFPIRDGERDTEVVRAREFPSAVMLSYGECAVLGMVIMVITLMLPHPARHLGKLLMRLFARIAPYANGRRCSNFIGDLQMVKKHVFLSYCHADEKEATRLQEELVLRGENVWWDKELKPGADWKLAIRLAIRDSYAVIVILSDALVEKARSGVFPELNHAVSILQEYPPGSIYLIPVRITDCEIPPFQIDSNRTLDSLHWVDLFPPWVYDDALDRVVNAVREAREHP